MCNTNRNPNKGKEKLNEGSIVNFKNNENKRKAIVLTELDTEIYNFKSPNNDNAGEESSKEISSFLLFGFIIDPNKTMKHGYSCNFCSRKFINPQALGGHQNCHRLERRLKKRAEDMNKDWINYSNGTQLGLVSQNTIIPYYGGYGYQYNGYYNMFTNEVGQGIVSTQITMPEIEYGLVSSGGADGEDKETQEEKGSKIDFTLKL